MRNRRAISAFALIVLFVIMLTGCGRNDIKSEETAASPRPTKQNALQYETAADDEKERGEAEPSEEDIEASEVDLMRFSSLDELNEFIAQATDGGDIAHLSELDKYYLPKNIPTEYKLYKITAGAVDIGFWYLPEEYLSSDDKIIEGEANQKHFLFISPRYSSTMENVDISGEESVDEKTYLRESATDVLFREEGGRVLMLYLPADYTIDKQSISELCEVETIAVG